jgi:hypothetical protein
VTELEKQIIFYKKLEENLWQEKKQQASILRCRRRKRNGSSGAWYKPELETRARLYEKCVSTDTP